MQDALQIVSKIRVQQLSLSLSLYLSTFGNLLYLNAFS